MTELRRDPVNKRWVIIASGRAKRPEHFKRDAKQTGAAAVICPFCPGNEDKTPPEIATFPERRSKNGPGWQVRVIPNKFNAVGVDEKIKVQPFGMYLTITGYGAHEVIIESPNHNVLFEDQSLAHLMLILSAYKERLIDLYKDPNIKQIVLYKNHGAEGGASISHPHSQLITFPIVPQDFKDDMKGAKEYFEKERSCLWCSILKWEMFTNYSVNDEDGQLIKNDPAGIRLVYKNSAFMAYCPFASRYPYEIHIIPRKHSHSFGDIGIQEIRELAETLKVVIKKLNVSLKEIYSDSVPFNFVLHTAPNLNFQGNGDKFETIRKDFHWHIELYPVLSIQAGVEKGSGLYINIVAPEVAAKELREAAVGQEENIGNKKA